MVRGSRCSKGEIRNMVWKTQLSGRLGGNRVRNLGGVTSTFMEKLSGGGGDGWALCRGRVKGNGCRWGGREVGRANCVEG